MLVYEIDCPSSIVWREREGEKEGMNEWGNENKPVEGCYAKTTCFVKETNKNIPMI